MRVDRLPPEIIEQYHDGGVSFPVVVYGGYEPDGRMLAVGGLGWIEGRCVLWLDVFGNMSPNALTLCRWAKRMLRMAGQMGERRVFVFRDEWQPASAKLLSMLGFEMVGVMVTDGMEDGKEIHECQV
jgi:hypothetical protein